MPGQAAASAGVPSLMLSAALLRKFFFTCISGLDCCPERSIAGVPRRPSLRTAEPQNPAGWEPIAGSHQ